MQPSVYCIVVTYNAEMWLKKCIESVLSSTLHCEIVVVDNHSSDRTCSLLTNDYPSVTLIRNDQNLGFGRANNIGLSFAYSKGAQYFFLLNQDAWVEPDTIEQLVRIHANNPQFGILSPVQLFDKNNIDSKFRSYVKKYSEDELLSRSPDDNPLEVRFVNAAIWLINLECLRKVGLFSPLFYHYAEDLNFAHRCRFHGIKIGVCPGLRAYHERKQAKPPDRSIPFRKLLARDESYSLGILLNINHPFIRQILFLLFNLVKELFKSFFLLRFINILILVTRLKMALRLGLIFKERNKMMQVENYVGFAKGNLNG